MITLVRASEICDNKLLTLESDFQQRAREWLHKMQEISVYPLIYCGFRSFTEQDALYAQGRTKAGRIVTKARGGQSYHNYGLAYDWVALRENPKNRGFYESDWDNDEAYRIGDAIGHALKITPIEWESGHMQDARYKKFSDIPAKGTTKVVQAFAENIETKKPSFFSSWKSR